MSALAAIVGGDPRFRDRRLAIMMDCQRHRDVDGSARVCTADVALGFQLLRTLPEDPPKASITRSDDVLLVADARIDNRAALIDEGCGDAGSSDPELLLGAYRRWGAESPGRVRGDFAAVLWDARARRLMAFRDPIGVRHLYYARVGEA